MDLSPSRAVEILLVALCYRNRNKLGRGGTLWLDADCYMKLNNRSFFSRVARSTHTKADAFVARVFAL